MSYLTHIVSPAGMVTAEHADTDRLAEKVAGSLPGFFREMKKHIVRTKQMVTTKQYLIEQKGYMVMDGYGTIEVAQTPERAKNPLTIFQRLALLLRWSTLCDSQKHHLDKIGLGWEQERDLSLAKRAVFVQNYLRVNFAPICLDVDESLHEYNSLDYKVTYELGHRAGTAHAIRSYLFRLFELCYDALQPDSIEFRLFMYHGVEATGFKAERLANLKVLWAKVQDGGWENVVPNPIKV